MAGNGNFSLMPNCINFIYATVMIPSKFHEPNLYRFFCNWSFKIVQIQDGAMLLLRPHKNEAKSKKACYLYKHLI